MNNPGKLIRGILPLISILLCCSHTVKAQLPWYLLSDALPIDATDTTTLNKGETFEFAITDSATPLPILLDFSADLSLNRYQNGESGKYWEIILTGNDSAAAKITFHWQIEQSGLEEEKQCIVRAYLKETDTSDFIKQFEANIPVPAARPLGKANVRLDYNGGVVGIYAGNPERTYAGSITLDAISRVEISANSKLTLANISQKTLRSRSESVPGLSMTAEGLLRTPICQLGNIIDKGVEGYWQPLDRETDSSWALPASRYTLAIIPHRDLTPVIGKEPPFRESRYEALQHRLGELPDNPPLYDIYAITGEEAKLKGMLFATPFSDYYELRWVDATGNPMLFDLTAALENNSILSLYFPLWHCTLRFSRAIRHNQ